MAGNALYDSGQKRHEVINSQAHASPPRGVQACSTRPDLPTDTRPSLGHGRKSRRLLPIDAAGGGAALPRARGAGGHRASVAGPRSHQETLR